MTRPTNTEKPPWRNILRLLRWLTIVAMGTVMIGFLAYIGFVTLKMMAK